ncbi:isopeptide-forming domain-containing fimbrial protein, partial [Luteimonas huabeiensis]|uniref:isopeptide-forming domain-containing fimbrial protein n=1 Tax=Luteimonas huabeiensis TaxID=1244513 RepID=UPI001362AE4E
MLQNKIRTARAAAAGMVLTLVAGLAGLGASPVLAQATPVTNVATVVAPADTVDIDPDNNTDSVTVTVSPAAPAYSFCTAPGGNAASNAIYSIVNGVQIWRYEAGAGSDAVVPELALPSLAGNDVNALMIDPVNDRMLFHASTGSMLWAYDAGNGGWYQALSAPLGGDFPRAGMGPDGVGYLIGNGGSPVVYRVTANATGFGYAVQNIGNLQYDFAPTNIGSGDIAFDAAGFGWLAAGQDLYRIDFSAPGGPRAIRQTRPLLNGQPSTVLWAGIAFGDDDRLYVANNNSPSSYYAYDTSTGVLSQAAPTGANASRDLASCAFPDIAEPELSVGKTLAEVNGTPYVDGAPVAPGDVLTYAITIANAGGAVGTLFAGDVGETVPANTAYVSEGNDFTCAGATCLNTAALNIPANGEATLNFVVRIDDPLAASATEIVNAVTFPNGAIDCSAPGNDCNETTPLGPTIAVAKSADPADGTAVAAGQAITYTLTVTVANAATRSDVVLTDTLGAGLTFGQVVNAGAFLAVPTGGGDPNDPGAPPPTCADCETQHPLAPSVAVTKEADPVSGEAVAAGQTLTYTLSVTVGNANTQSDVVLTDTLGAGLTFGQVENAGAFLAGGSGSVRTFTLPAVPTGGGDPNDPGAPPPTCASCETQHPLSPVVAVTKTADPASG